LKRTISLPCPPKRIISLVPSQTELLFDLGLEAEVIGITKFCIHPAKWFRGKTRIGGTKTVNLHKVATLNPDLIIANKEENVREQVEELAKNFPLWISDINNLEQAYVMINSIGHITSKQEAADFIIKRIKDGFSQLQAAHSQPRTAYLIWKDPYMSVGGDTFIHHLMEAAGFNNVFGHLERYPQFTIEVLQQAGCELLLLSSEPYPFKEKHITELQQYLPQTNIRLVDGEMFSWYGSRLMRAPAYFQQLRQQLALLL
jgi:ABC-type Fe3+-hydroxamate transport system substrate-binding protein